MKQKKWYETNSKGPYIKYVGGGGGEFLQEP